MERGDRAHNRKTTGASETIVSVALNGNGQRVLSASADSTLELWDLETGRSLRMLEGHSEPAYSVALSADGRRALSGSNDKTIRFWDLGTGQCLGRMEGHTAAVVSVALSPHGRRAISAGSWDKTLKLWDLDRQDVSSNTFQASSALLIACCGGAARCACRCAAPLRFGGRGSSRRCGDEARASSRNPPP